MGELDAKDTNTLACKTRTHLRLPGGAGSKMRVCTSEGSAENTGSTSSSGTAGPRLFMRSYRIWHAVSISSWPVRNSRMSPAGRACTHMHGRSCACGEQGAVGAAGMREIVHVSSRMAPAGTARMHTHTVVCISRASCRRRGRPTYIYGFLSGMAQESITPLLPGF